MARFVALYTRPQDPEGFLARYRDQHLPITQRWPGVTATSTTVMTGTPRGGEPSWWLLFVATWDSMDDLQAAMTDPSMRQAGADAQEMLQEFGNTAEMLIGDDL